MFVFIMGGLQFLELVLSAMNCSLDWWLITDPSRSFHHEQIALANPALGATPPTLDGHLDQFETHMTFNDLNFKR